MVSTCVLFHLLGSPPLLQVFPLGIHGFHVFEIVGEATPGACQNAPLATLPS